ncbi:A-factor biosynthesis hotdog domain-containing protein [Streptomyces sp. WMMB 714]|uniref:ScbA/BarX family gamma-butyrolactone biosynthesis protein n=1 Tax=Streptomyces sp. WMMB 714 TaxID=1286822 RepID=UPI0005F8208F|nr:ScbA/BarX family gamma-butyrolactone biosynthesis protein [Streptomyces sp. WMMB 714]SCK31600.1 A-factor biosynthesis hotdog domain-containing protein [Streptomyces sp. WMMB 714]
MIASTAQVTSCSSGIPEEAGPHPAHLSQALSHFPPLTTTVPKEFVHRAAVAEVLLTSWTPRSGTEFRVTAQWPRCHSYFAPVDGRYDPLFAAETIRQIGALLAHTGFDVPLGHKFLMWDLEFAVVPEQLRIAGAPASLDIDVSCTEVDRRPGGALKGLRYEAVLRQDGQTVATGGASFTCTRPEVHDRLRRDRPRSDESPLPLTAPLPPQHVGRTSPVDVVLSPIGEAGRWLLRADTRHPVLFDHPVDHVPGMVLLEATRQAAHALLGHAPFPVSARSTFERYAELDAPCMVEARELPDKEGSLTTVLVTATQGDEQLFSSTLAAARL